MERGKTKKISVEAAVIGGSHGSLATFRKIIAQLSAPLSFPLVVVFHQSPDSQDGLLESIVQQWSVMKVKEAEDKEALRGGVVYLAPPGYHLLVEESASLALSTDELVFWSRPAIDPLFQSAADAFKGGLLGVVLSGASEDGAAGLRSIVDRGGFAIVQEPETAQATAMPRAALASCSSAAALNPAEIAEAFRGLKGLLS